MKKAVEVPPWEKLALTVQEAAALLGLSEAAVYNLVHTEGFPAIQPGGGKWIINRLRLQDWLDRRTEATA